MELNGNIQRNWYQIIEENHKRKVILDEWWNVFWAQLLFAKIRVKFGILRFIIPRNIETPQMYQSLRIWQF